MPTAEKATTKRETWTDWIPNVDPTLTIEDVVAGVRQMGINDVTSDQIRFWQRQGVLPAPIRRKPGEGKGKARALYPPHAVPMIAMIRVMKRDGVPLRQIGAGLARMFDNNVPENDRFQLDILRAMEHLLEPPDDALLEAVTAAAERQEQRVGSPIRQVEVTFTDARDRKHSHVFPLEPKTDP